MSQPFAIDGQVSLSPAAAEPKLTDGGEAIVAKMVAAESRTAGWLGEARGISLRYGVLSVKDGPYNGATGYYLRIADGPTCLQLSGVVTSLIESASGTATGQVIPPMPADAVPCIVGIFQATDESGVSWTQEGVR